MDVEFLRYRFEDRHDGIITKTKFKFGVRHVQMMYMFLCSLVIGMLRGSSGVAVIAVADYTRSNETYIQIHDWNNKVQGAILSSFYFGYAVMLIPAELYLKQLGDKLVLTAILLINGALSAAMPTIINKGGWVAVCNAQLFIGMTQACVTPINQKLISNWLLPSERKLFSYGIHSALHLGTIIALPISGLLSETQLGWELIYYAQAMMVLSMATMWVLLTASTPDRHEAVGDTEKEMIKEALTSYKQKKLQAPWRRILHSKSFWALASSHSAANVMFIFFLTEVPALLHSMNRYLKKSALQTAFPFLAMWLVYTLTSPIADFAYRIVQFSYIFDLRYFRKIVNGFGALGIAVSLVLVPNLITGRYGLSLVVLIMILALIGVQYSGFLENHKDVTENFPGTLLMLTSAVASVVGSSVPFVCGIIIGDDVTDIKNWTIIFYSLAVIYSTSNILYTAFASTDRQSWDTSDTVKVGYNNDATNMELDEINTIKPHNNPGNHN